MRRLTRTPKQPGEWRRTARMLCGTVRLHPELSSTSADQLIPNGSLSAPCVITGMEFVGEVCADFLGLNDSQYQWIIDEHRRREAEVWQLRLLLRTAVIHRLYMLCMEQRRRRLRRLKALKAAKEAREVDDMEGGASASMGGTQLRADGSEGAEVDEKAPLLAP